MDANQRTDLVIEPLGAQHDRSGFACGQPRLDDYLRRYALQNQKRDLGRTYVAVEGESGRVIGFFTLANGSVERANLPSEIKVRYNPVPAVILAQLAVDRSRQGEGIGEWLLVEALKHCREIADRSGAFVVVVHALDAAVSEFYRRFGFKSLLDDSNHLFLTMQTIRKS